MRGKFSLPCPFVAIVVDNTKPSWIRILTDRLTHCGFTYNWVLRMGKKKTVSKTFGSQILKIKSFVYAWSINIIFMPASCVTNIPNSKHLQFLIIAQFNMLSSVFLWGKYQNNKQTKKGGREGEGKGEEKYPTLYWKTVVKWSWSCRSVFLYCSFSQCSWL